MGEKRVLYIEDNGQLRWMVMEILEFEGFRMFGADCGLQGLDTAQRVKPHLILTDIDLPDINGFEVLARLRAVPDVASVPVLVVTANGVDKDQDYYARAGFDGCLFKPFDAGQIVHIVREYIARAEHRAAPTIIPGIALQPPQNVV